MSEEGEEPQRRRWRVLVSDGSVAVDEEGAVASVPPEAAEGGYPLAPQLQLDAEGPVLLDIREPADPSAYASWRTLDDADGPPTVVHAVGDAMRTYGGRAPLPERRPEWFVRSWRGELDAWIDDRLPALGRRRTGELVPLKVWSLSAVLLVPTDHGPLYVKAACDWFRAEPGVTEVLGDLWPGQVTALVATEPDRGWQLMEPLTGVSDEDDPDPGLAAPTAAAMARLQVEAVDHLDKLRAAGLPDRGLAATLTGLRHVAEHSPELRLLDSAERAAVHAVLPEVERRLAGLASWGVPETLVHGDLHLGNVAHHDGALVIFDWTDTCLAHPFVDLATLLRSSPAAEREELRSAYLTVWRDRLDLPDDATVEREAFVVERAYQALTYDLIQAAQEDVSVWELEGVVASCLRRLVETVGAG